MEIRWSDGVATGRERAISDCARCSNQFLSCASRGYADGRIMLRRWRIGAIRSGAASRGWRQLSRPFAPNALPNSN